MSKIQYEIKKIIATLSTTAKGWSKELNLVSWNGYPPKYDIRDWDSTHTKMGKGVTLSEEELKALYQALKQMFEGESTKEPDTPNDNWKDQLQKWLTHSPLFIQQIKNVLSYMNEKGFSIEMQKKIFIGSQPLLSEEALQYEIESISSIYSPLFEEFVQCIRSLDEENIEAMFREIGKL
jgi:hypothetical protein